MTAILQSLKIYTIVILKNKPLINKILTCNKSVLLKKIKNKCDNNQGFMTNIFSRYLLVLNAIGKPTLTIQTALADNDKTNTETSNELSRSTVGVS